MKNDLIQKSLSYVVKGGVATSIMDTLATGPTLIAYATFFGAGNIAFGILGAIPYLGNLIHLFVAWLIEKGVSVRKISLYASLLSRPFYLLAALLAFNPNMTGALFLLISFLSASYLIGCMAGGAWLPWMKILVPQQSMGRFFSHRFKYMMLAKIICFLGISFFLKYIHQYYPDKDIYAYSFLLIAAFMIGLYGAWTFSKITDCRIPTQPDTSFIPKLKLTFKNKAFTSLLISLSILNFSSAFMTPFLTVFMLKRFDIKMSTILIFTLILQIIYIITIKKWGKIADKKGADTILMLSIPLFISASFGLIFLNQLNRPDIFMLYTLLIIIHIIFGIASAGLTLGINNVSLLCVPEQMSAIYLSVNSTVKSFAGALGSIIAGGALSFYTMMEKTILSPPEKAGWTSFYITAILLCLLAGYLLKCMQTRNSQNLISN